VGLDKAVASRSELCAVCSARSDFVAGIRVGGGYRDMASVVESDH
jgi:hypothetical protein